MLNTPVRKVSLVILRLVYTWFHVCVSIEHIRAGKLHVPNTCIFSNTFSTKPYILPIRAFRSQGIFIRCLLTFSIPVSLYLSICKHKKVFQHAIYIGLVFEVRTVYLINKLGTEIFGFTKTIWMKMLRRVFFVTEKILY